MSFEQFVPAWPYQGKRYHGDLRCVGCGERKRATHRPSCPHGPGLVERGQGDVAVATSDGQTFPAQLPLGEQAA